MTEDAVRRQFERYVDLVADRAMEEARPVRAAVDAEVPLSGGLETVLRPKTRREIDAVRSSVRSQVDVVCSCARQPDRLNGCREAFVERDHFYSSYEGPRAAELRRTLESRFERLVDDARPLVESPQAEFWPACREAYGREEAREVVHRQLSFADDVAEYRGGLELTVSVGVGPLSRSVDVTGEALRVLTVAEADLRDHVSRELDAFYSDRSLA